MDFRRVVREGRRARAGGLTVFVSPRPEGAAPSRLGMSVRTRGSVERNRVRRRLRAAFREAVQPGYDVVITAGSGVAEEDFQKLVQDMERALSRAMGR